MRNGKAKKVRIWIVIFSSVVCHSGKISVLGYLSSRIDSPVKL
jgi:hypothetical protein